ncbi:hypothetical protein C8Q74DRAFT_1364337 [Fomes fomentarius]|nr:hypothetical protein C8Q74DRAFT_1364337 [Fomes fomentarius]
MRLQVRSFVSLFPALSFILVVFSEHASAELFVFPPGTLTLEQCSQVDLFWQPEQPPFQLWVAPDREIAPGDPTLRTLGPINDTEFHWTVDLPVGQNFSFTYIRLEDPYTLYASGE